MMDEIVCQNLRKAIDKRIILHDVSFRVTKGKIVALLGPNGAGKTTSFSMLCGLIKPDHGRIFLNQKDITDLPMYKRARLGVGYLPQETSVFTGLTVEENIIAVLEMNNIHARKWRAILEKLLADLSLESVRKSPAVGISGGERRKLEIARALATKPSFMLLDEPLAGIDPLAVMEMRQMILALRHRGIGVVITDHNVRETLPLADYAYILYEGRVLVEGTPQQIINSPRAREIYLGESFADYNRPHERES
ncbi:MAG: LPS export ABC transporter ATP-binding protein [Holosporaceae bacterium]|jgi:lipopolysaccharide export system ATP-binding protein|nr:LPS export ABC transporter ATP-binding protein [Holosporaceae bacterium]